MTDKFIPEYIIRHHAMVRQEGSYACKYCNKKIGNAPSCCECILRPFSDKSGAEKISLLKKCPNEVVRCAGCYGVLNRDGVKPCDGRPDLENCREKEVCKRSGSFRKRVEQRVAQKREFEEEEFERAKRNKKTNSDMGVVDTVDLTMHEPVNMHQLLLEQNKSIRNEFFKSMNESDENDDGQFSNPLPVLKNSDPEVLEQARRAVLDNSSPSKSILQGLRKVGKV